MHEGVRLGVRFTWLCVTHKGVGAVNEAALLSLRDPVTEQLRACVIIKLLHEVAMGVGA